MTDWPLFFREHMQTPEGTLERSQLQARDLVRTLEEEELQILTYLVEGWGGRAIAAELEIGLSEFEASKRQLLSKLNAESTSDLVRIGIYADLAL